MPKIKHNATLLYTFQSKELSIDIKLPKPEDGLTLMPDILIPLSEEKSRELSVELGKIGIKGRGGDKWPGPHIIHDREVYGIILTAYDLTKLAYAHNHPFIRGGDVDKSSAELENIIREEIISIARENYVNNHT